MIKLYVKITKQNGKIDSKQMSYHSETECEKDMEGWFNNPTYQTIGYHVGENVDGKNKYYLNLKSVA